MAAIFNERSQYEDTQGRPLAGGKIFFGKVGLDPKLNPENIFSNPELTAALANPQILDTLGRATNQVYIEGRYSLRIEDVNELQIQETLIVGVDPGTSGPIILGNVQGTNALTATASPTITEYVNGQEYRLQVLTANTLQMSLNIDTVGVKNITDSLDGLVIAGQWLSVYFNSVNDVFDTASTRNLASPAPIGNETPNAIDGTIIKASTRLEGILGSTNPAAITGTVIKANTSFQGNGGAIITQFDNGTVNTNSPTRGVTQLAVKTWAAQKGAKAIIQGDIATGAIGQGELKTTTGEVSTSGVGVVVVGAGGQYGFWPEVKIQGVATTTDFVAPLAIAAGVANTAYRQLFNLGSANAPTVVFARSRFVQASPPYDIGDGECHSFIFAIVDSLGKIESMYHAPDPPWANNGPTCIRSEYKKKGKLYRKTCVVDKTKHFSDPTRTTYVEQEITIDFKNSDMALIPHPFQGNDLAGKSIILIDPGCDIVRIAEDTKEGEESALEELFHNDYVRFGNEPLAGRATPHSDVMVVKPTWKDTK